MTGKVAKFVVADVERDYDFDLDPELYVEYEGKPAIIAQAVAPAPKPGEITQTQYYGRTLAVAGEIENIIVGPAFTLDEDKLVLAICWCWLRIQRQPTQRSSDGEYVAVTGVLRSFVVADIERDYDLTWDLNLQRQLEVDYRNKPVL